jgi:hypothetical protein
VVAGTLLSGICGAASAVADSGSTVSAAQQVSAPPVAYDPGADRQDMVREVFASFCADDPDGELHTAEWYTAVDSWQAVLPYRVNRLISPSALAREQLFGEPRLTEDTRKDTCDSMTRFAEALKNATLDIKGSLWDGCTTAAGLSEFYDYKMEVFRAIDDHNWPKVTALMPGWRDPAKMPETLSCPHVAGA